jgi:hypothetical protein
MNIQTYEPPLSPPEPEPGILCEDCEEEFWGDEVLVRFRGRKICPTCFRECIVEMELHELCEAFGADTTTAENIQQELADAHGDELYERLREEALC